MSQCDETRPACLKCIKSKRICPGYVEGLDLVLRDQTQSAKARAERYQKPRNKSRNQNPETASGSATPQPLTIYTPFAECQETHAHTFFVSAYVLAPRDTRTDHGFLELLPLLFDRLLSSPVLNLSLSVVAHCYFQAWQPDVRNINHIVVQKLYSRAIKALQMALQDPQQCTSDETLMAVCLLSFYEVGFSLHSFLRPSRRLPLLLVLHLLPPQYTVGAVLSRPQAAQHVDGVSAIIKQRCSTNMTSNLSKRLLVAARHSIVYSPGSGEGTLVNQCSGIQSPRQYHACV